MGVWVLSYTKCIHGIAPIEFYTIFFMPADFFSSIGQVFS